MGQVVLSTSKWKKVSTFPKIDFNKEDCFCSSVLNSLGKNYTAELSVNEEILGFSLLFRFRLYFFDGYMYFCWKSAKSC